MFERRLKVILGLTFAAVLVLVVRAAQVQLLAGDYWQDRAAASMKRTQLTETTRGRVLDVKGREVAVDEACTDLCVDYRAIPREPDEVWVKEVARGRLRRRTDEAYRSASRQQRAAMLDQEAGTVRTQIEIMWARIARLSGKAPEEIDEIRRAIIQRVLMRQRHVWYYNYVSAVQKHEKRDPGPWYRQWLLDDSADAPRLDSFAIKVAEQEEPHVIIRDFTDTNNELGKNIDQYPGLVLRASKHRVYPFQEVGAHVMGHLSTVGREDLTADPNADDELREYLPNDLIGRGGLEALCEPVLRGSRGRIERVAGKEQVVGRIEPVPGRDVRMTMDMELAFDVHQAFIARREYKNREGVVDEVRERQHGAAVVIDVATGQVRAMVSYPSFDVNRLDELYATLLTDDLNKPMFHRATMTQFPPGSTVKSILGAGAITDGTIGAAEGIECTGYLVINGHKMQHFRCWVARQFESVLGPNGVAHHPIPYVAPHATGFLTISDALERSCNVVFETLADRMGSAAVAGWMDRFGLGRATGIGISEARGRILDADNTNRAVLWSAGIGQGEVSATPLQMANVAATIARRGVWVRPRILVEEGSGFGPEGSGLGVQGSGKKKAATADRVDLGLSAEAVGAVREGMKRVANSQAGTGEELRRKDMVVAGKTGSAQTGRMSVPKRDRAGEVVRENGRQVSVPVDLGTPGTETWYVGVGPEKKDLAHAWIIGYAPAEDPKVAFCVLVEFGGNGGKVAGDVAADVLEACVAHGYLSPDAEKR